jgi:hypothetical protein
VHLQQLPLGDALAGQAGGHLEGTVDHLDVIGVLEAFQGQPQSVVHQPAARADDVRPELELHGEIRRRHTNVRANVRSTPGPCAQWSDDDADFIREVLDMLGDKWSG